MKHLSNKMLTKIAAIGLFAGFATYLVLPSLAQTPSAQAYITPATKTVTQNEVVSTALRLNTNGNDVNVVTMIVLYPADKLELKSVYYMETAFEIQVEEVKGVGQVRISRATNPAKAGNLLIAGMDFQVKAASDTVSITISSDSEAYSPSDDGLSASDVLGQSVGSVLTVSAPVTPEPTTPPPASDPTSHEHHSSTSTSSSGSSGGSSGGGQSTTTSSDGISTVSPDEEPISPDEDPESEEASEEDQADTAVAGSTTTPFLKRQPVRLVISFAVVGAVVFAGTYIVRRRHHISNELMRHVNIAPQAAPAAPGMPASPVIVPPNPAVPDSNLKLEPTVIEPTVSKPPSNGGEGGLKL